MKYLISWQNLSCLHSLFRSNSKTNCLKFYFIIYCFYQIEFNGDSGRWLVYFFRLCKFIVYYCRSMVCTTVLDLYLLLITLHDDIIHDRRNRRYRSVRCLIFLFMLYAFCIFEFLTLLMKIGRYLVFTKYKL